MPLLWGNRFLVRGGPRSDSTYLIRPSHSAYQSECRENRPQCRHWVSLHRNRHSGHTPPVSKVFQVFPHTHSHTSYSRGVQPQRGQRIYGPELSTEGDCSGCSSRTVVRFGMTVSVGIGSPELSLKHNTGAPFGKVPLLTTGCDHYVVSSCAP